MARDMPAVAQILADGLDLGTGVTVLAGENGAGKSTVVEVIAEACGLNPQGGQAKARFQTRDSEPGIGDHLWAERGPGYPAWTYFLRADTMHGLYSYLEENPGRRPERFHELSHGEGFLEILRTRINQPGFRRPGYGRSHSCGISSTRRRPDRMESAMPCHRRSGGLK